MIESKPLFYGSAETPKKAHFDDAGWDLKSTEFVIIEPFSCATIGTETKMNIPTGHAGMVCSRSGLASKKNVFVLNAPGIIDSGYIGECKVILFNLGKEPFTVEIGSKIAQLLIVKLMDTKQESEHTTDPLKIRGEAGFGSTGI